MSLHTKKQTKEVQRHITDILNDKTTVIYIYLYNVIGDKMLVCNSYRIRILYESVFKTLLLNFNCF